MTLNCTHLNHIYNTISLATHSNDTARSIQEQAFANAKPGVCRFNLYSITLLMPEGCCSFGAIIFLCKYLVPIKGYTKPT